MNKKKPPEDFKGFEEFIEAESDKSFMGKPQGGNKKEGVEHMTFLSHDTDRLKKIKTLLSDKLPFATRFDQSKQILKEQNDQLQGLRTTIYTLSDRKDSPYRKSLSEIFNSFFKAQE